MQDNSFKIGAIIFFVGLCSYYLAPSVMNAYYQSEMESLSDEALVEYRDDNRSSLQWAKQNSLKLGLDLQGGMHVTLEVRVANLLNQLATNKDETFNDVLRTASRRAEQEGTSVVDEFLNEFQSRDAEVRLSRYFRSEEDNITRRSSNDEIEDYLRREADEAVDRAMEIVRNRVDRYGVTEPSIQKKGDRRISVELPGIDDPQRVRNLLESASQLTFHLMADPQRMTQSVQEIIEYYEPTAADSVAADSAVADTSAPATDTPDGDGTELMAGGESDTTDAGTQLTPGAQDGASGPQNQLLAAMQPLPYQQNAPVFGRVMARDTAKVNDLLSRPQVQQMLPPGIELMYTANPLPTQGTGGREAFDLLAVQSEIELGGDVITDAGVNVDQQTGEARVSVSMNGEGAKTWSRITGANVGSPVAIVLDDVVYSYPVIQERIPGGRTSISGLESRQEASDIVTVLQSGALPAPVDIIEERTVGPSLGAESIQAGFISVIVGLVLVALFMIFYYRSAGVVADIALLLNVVLILGILAGFKATLTLPGIAGIVLTIGMAVDANVLIFERIREEQSTGKTLKAAVSTGYEKSLSAILDANITTFFVGVILYSFGVGPIQGFAVTLMAGILSSLFTAIIVTRVLFDYLLAERQKLVSYG